MDLSLNELLIEASKKRQPRNIKKLLDEGANINCCDIHGNTPLMHIIYYQYSKISPIDLVQFCLNHGADIHAINYRDENALMRACQRGYLDVVHALLELGAKQNIFSIQGYMAINYAEMGRHDEVVNLLVGRLPMDEAKKMIFDRHWQNIAYKSAQKGKCQMLRNALQHLKTPDFAYGTRTLWTACCHWGKNQFRCVDMLLEHGGNINYQVFHDQQDSGLTGLMLAAQCDHLEMVRFLLGRGASPDVKDGFGKKADQHVRVANAKYAQDIVSLMNSVRENNVLLKIVEADEGSSDGIFF